MVGRGSQTFLRALLPTSARPAHRPSVRSRSWTSRPPLPRPLAARPGGRAQARAAARARKAATALSVATMLSLGGALAWRDGQAATTTRPRLRARARRAPPRASDDSTSSSTSDSDDATRRPRPPWAPAPTRRRARPRRRSSTTTESHTSTRRELTDGQDPLVRRPVQRPRRVGADPRHHRVGSAARHQGRSVVVRRRPGC